MYVNIYTHTYDVLINSTGHKHKHACIGAKCTHMPLQLIVA